MENQSQTAKLTKRILLARPLPTYRRVTFDHPPLNIFGPEYLRDFNRLHEATVNARQLYDAMLELYPDRVNPGSLWGGEYRQEAGIGSISRTK